jgi:hypothetical protein
MNAVNIEIRDSSLHISGYVNAVGRDSRVINTRDGRCVEQIEAGAFAASLADGHEVRMKLNHKRDIGSTADGTLTLKEDNIGLYAEAVTEDEELRTLAAENKLTGWSFGFVKKDGIMEERGRDIPKRRIIKALDLSEVSILSVTPAYCGTSVECRAETETRSYNDYEEENTAAPEDEEKRRYREAVRGKVQCFLMREKIKKMKGMGKAYEVRAFLAEAKERTREYEERYNHYHDPSNGQFASGKGGGMGLYYSMGKGKGAIVGESSSLVPSAVRTAQKKIENILVKAGYGDIVGDPQIKRNNGNWDITVTQKKSILEAKSGIIGVGDIPARTVTTTTTYTVDPNGKRIGKKRTSSGNAYAHNTQSDRVTADWTGGNAAGNARPSAKVMKRLDTWAKMQTGQLSFF